MNNNPETSDDSSKPANESTKKKRAAKSKRVMQIQRAVEVGIEQWYKTQGTPLTAVPSDRRANSVRVNDSHNSHHVNTRAEHNSSNGRAHLSPADIFQALPRRQPITSQSTTEITPPMMRFITFEPSLGQVAKRFFLWLFMGVNFSIGILWDKVRRKDTVERRAVRLRKILESAGGTFVKIGQQMSLRIDLLPYAYCLELGKMLDRMPPFSTEYAIETIERVTKKPLADTFLFFDPQPVGSASIACVYQATLRKNGKKVAIKVRRPNIGEVFAADFRILDLVSGLLEFLTILRSGFTHNFRSSLRDALMEELDFHQEARYQELFRNRVKKTKTSFLSAPKIYFELSSEDVIVMDFISEIPLSEVLTSVEQNDKNGMAMLRKLNIEPKKVAWRLLWVNHAAMIADLFFHSDPSPANIFVKRNSKLVFIDFGATGSFSQSQRRALKQINYYQNNDDPEGMARASLALMEPLPPIDIDAFTKELEELYRSIVYAVNSKHSEWWERTSAAQWLAFAKITLKYNVPLPRGLLNMVRATLLYDTIAARLDKNTIFYEEFRRYEKFAGKKARKRIKTSVKTRLKKGLTPTDYLKLEQTVDLFNRATYRIQHILDAPPLRFSYMINKWVFAILVALQAVTISSIITGLILAFTSMTISQEMSLPDSLQQIVSNGWYQLLILIIILLSIRRILFRFNDKDV